MGPKNAQALYSRGLAKRDKDNNADADVDIAAAKALRSNISEVSEVFRELTVGPADCGRQPA
jgi:hypothetical protein